MSFLISCMYVCMIMHNMIIQDEGGVVLEPCFEPLGKSSTKEGTSTSTSHGYGPWCGLELSRFTIGDCTNWVLRHPLRTPRWLKEHHWQLKKRNYYEWRTREYLYLIILVLGFVILLLPLTITVMILTPYQSCCCYSYSFWKCHYSLALNCLKAKYYYMSFFKVGFDFSYVLNGFT